MLVPTLDKSPLDLGRIWTVLTLYCSMQMTRKLPSTLLCLHTALYCNTGSWMLFDSMNQKRVSENVSILDRSKGNLIEVGMCHSMMPACITCITLVMTVRSCMYPSCESKKCYRYFTHFAIFRLYLVFSCSPTHSHHLWLTYTGCTIMLWFLLPRPGLAKPGPEQRENDCAFTLANPGLRRFNILFRF